MPNYKTHVISAILIYYLILFFLIIYDKFLFNLDISLLWLIAIILGALFPDIDIKSKGQKIFYFLFLLNICLALICKNYNIAILISLFSFLPILSNHRGIFHNIFFLITLTIFISKILTYNLPEYKFSIESSLIFFLIGAASHIFLDFKYKKIFK